MILTLVQYTDLFDISFSKVEKLIKFKNRRLLCLKAVNSIFDQVA